MLALEKRTVWARAEKIDAPGEYKFNSCGEWDGKHLPWSEVPSDSIMGEQPRVKYEEMIVQLKRRFPHAGLQRFIAASLAGGEYTPARFEYALNWGNFTGGGNHLFGNDFIVIDGEIYFMTSGGNYSNGGGNWSFRIEDTGNLSIARNKLVKENPVGRDGEFSLRLSGDAPHHSCPPKNWRAWIDYSGENPGRMVREAVNHVNSEKARLNTPLWRKVVES